MSKPRVWYIQTASHTERVFDPADYQRMLDSFEVTVNETDRRYSSEDLAAENAGFDGLVTGWSNAPPITSEVMENADKLKIIAHSAGSIKHVVSREIIDKYLIPRDVVLFSANHAIAYNVAESAVGMLLMACHCWAQFAQSFRETGVWRPPAVRSNARFLQGSTVGVISASKVGREVIKLLSGWPLQLVLYDPYVTEEQAQELGVEKVELNELFERSDHVTIHAPRLPATDNLIGAEQLKLLRDGATLVNTARGNCLDHAALLAAAAAGRIYVVLDVTEPEPLPADSPFRTLQNVAITPHVSGAGFYGYHKIGEITVDALAAAFAGKPVAGAVDYSKYDILA